MPKDKKAKHERRSMKHGRTLFSRNVYHGSLEHPALTRTGVDDGTFWMDLTHFFMGFSSVDVCYAYRGWHATSFPNAFPPKSSPQRLQRRSKCSSLRLALWNMTELTISWKKPLIPLSATAKARALEVSTLDKLQQVILSPDATWPDTDREFRLTVDCGRYQPDEGEAPITDAKRGLRVIHADGSGPLPNVVITLRSTKPQGDKPLFLQLERFRAKSVCLQGTDGDLAEAAQVRNFRRVRLRLVDMQGVTIIKARHLRLDPADLAAYDAMRLAVNSDNCVVERGG
eukprot:g78868.t1